MSRARQVSQLIGASNNHLVATPATFSNTVAVANSGITFGDATAQLTAASGFGFKNRIINGDFRIDQRANGALANTNNTYNTADRWYVTSGWPASGQRVADGPNASFQYSMKFTGGTAIGSMSVSNWSPIQQLIEGYNCADFGWGTSSASTVTLSFWAKSSLTGTFGVSLFNGSSNDLSSSTVTRSYVATYTINAANTWEYKTITVPGCPDGSWNTTNGSGIVVWFEMGSGSNYQTTTANAWQTGKYVRTSACTNLWGTTGATFNLTGVQLEKGSTATAFDWRPYATELGLCYRYYQQWDGATNYSAFGSGVQYTTTQTRISMSLRVPMRSAPTVAYAGNVYMNNWGESGLVTGISNIYGTNNNGGLFIDFNNGAFGSARGGVVAFTGNVGTVADRLSLSSEL